MDSDLIASAPLPKERGVALKEIRLDGNTQCREAMDSEHIDNLVEALEDGASLPAAIVYHDGASYWLADGFHRYHAAQRREAAELWCEVRSGTRLDAVRHAVGANGSHGKPRTNADKRKAVMIALKEFPNLSSRAIAEKCGVSNKTVDQYRPASAPEDRRAGADGKTYSAGRYPGANRAPGDPAPLPDNFRVESKTPTGPTTEDLAIWIMSLSSVRCWIRILCAPRKSSLIADRRAMRGNSSALCSTRTVWASSRKPPKAGANSKPSPRPSFAAVPCGERSAGKTARF